MGYSSFDCNNNYVPKKLRKGKFSKIILISVIVTVLLYTVCALLIALCGSYVPDSLTYCFYGFFGVEVLSLATIKIKKMKGGDLDADREDSENYLRGDNFEDYDFAKEKEYSEIDFTDER